LYLPRSVRSKISGVFKFKYDLTDEEGTPPICAVTASRISVSDALSAADKYETIESRTIPGAARRYNG
jgi:hypothetical protein